METNPTRTDESEELVEFSWKDAKRLFQSHLRSAYSNKVVRFWSIWWILSATGYYMMYVYNQPLWHFINPNMETVYNGFAEGGLTLCGALGALLAAKLNQEFIEKWATVIVIVCSFFLGTIGIIAGHTTIVYVSYVMYVCFGAIFNFMITVTR